MNFIKKIGFLGMAGLLIVPLVSCGKTTEVMENKIIEVSSEPTKGFLWEATKDDKSIYLAGTMHPAPPKINFFNDNINEIIEKTDVVALEIDLTSEELIPDIQNYALKNYYLKSGEFKDLLTEEEGDKLDDLLNKLGFSYKDMKQMNEDGVNDVITSLIFQKLGFLGEIFDEQLAKTYKEKGKEVISLETFEFQADILNKHTTIETVKKGINEFDSVFAENDKSANDLLTGYITGDIKAGEIGIEEAKKDEALYKDLLIDRNIGMVEKINGFIKEDKSYLVAVGYLHFFGEDSIIKLMKKEGYTITIIE